jgi:cephalosporin hydroxylase
VGRRNLREAGVKVGKEVVVLAADVTDPATPDRVAEHVPRGARCLVVEDSAHTYATTIAALRGFARFVPPGGVFVVEDGVVDEEPLRPDDSWPRGVQQAVAEFLASPEGAAFTADPAAAVYGLTCHVGGYLRRAP